MSFSCVGSSASVAFLGGPKTSHVTESSSSFSPDDVSRSVLLGSSDDQFFRPVQEFAGKPVASAGQLGPDIWRLQNTNKLKPTQATLVARQRAKQMGEREREIR